MIKLNRKLYKKTPHTEAFMKKISLFISIVILITSVFLLNGCEKTVSINGNTTTAPQTTKKEPNTAVVEVTNEEGTVVSTQTVTMSKQDKETEKNFFNVAEKPNLSPNISQDRIEQALQQNKPASKPNKNDSGAPDINGDEEGNGGDNTNNEDVNVPYVQDDAAVLTSSQYMISARIVSADGTVENIKLAKKDKLSSVSLMYNGYPMTIILGGETWYWLSNSDKTYLKIPKAMIEENATDEEIKNMLMNDPLNFKREIKSTSTEKIDGVEYNVVTYKSGDKDYFIGKTIIKTVSTDGSQLIFDTVSPVAPSSLFTPPSDYTEMELDDESAGDMIEAISPSTEAHVHE